ncbi:uncharacterized protein NEMAJ01_1627 [Nematocida major]|uniref:uncharacterized protein n=1 Tax=Nematocida major TaxID=1912982 RepID=UPI00200807F9|nr:uncharacterized protein NEMAJ01_1627 [Nematocida major]KAH9386731.1 hypothetical protein NEMAJ01_1627 [Nematocida major]
MQDEIDTQSEEEFSSKMLLTPKLSAPSDEEYLKAIVLSRLIKHIFCASGLSKIKLPKEAQSPFKDHIHVKNVKIMTKSKERIGAWVVYNKEKDVAGWSLVLHGNSTNRNTFSQLYEVENLLNEGIGALIIDYRGFGDSEGLPSRSAFIEDVSAGVNYFRKKNIMSISIISYSLGTAIALEYLMRYTGKKMPVNIEKLVLVSPFSSTISLLREYKLWNFIEMVLPNSSTYAMHGLGYNSLQNIQKVRMRILIIHGAADWLIPCTHGEILAKNSNATFLKLENETHSTVFKNPLTWRTIAKFVENPPSSETPSA